MRFVHLIAVVLVIAALCLAIAGYGKAATGLFVLSTLIELGWSVVKGKSRNT